MSGSFGMSTGNPRNSKNTLEFLHIWKSGASRLQLFRYFGTTDAKSAILTNGLIYRFFTDLIIPTKWIAIRFWASIFLIFVKTRCVSLKILQIRIWYYLIFSTASELKYVHEFKNQFAEQVENPSDELTRLLFCKGATPAKKRRLSLKSSVPSWKKRSMIISARRWTIKIKNALGGSGGKAFPSLKANGGTSTEKDADVSDSNESKIVTTEEELEAYFIIKNLTERRRWPARHYI